MTSICYGISVTRNPSGLTVADAFGPGPPWVSTPGNVDLGIWPPAWMPTAGGSSLVASVYDIAARNATAVVLPAGSNVVDIRLGVMWPVLYLGAVESLADPNRVQSGQPNAVSIPSVLTGTPTYLAFLYPSLAAYP